MTLGAALTASLLAVLDRPSTWALALVGFLVRGGWLVVLAPIVVLPTAVGIANVVAPLLEDVAFGRNTEDVIRSGGTALTVLLVWLIVGGLLAAATEIETVRRTAGSAGIRSVQVVPGTNRTWRVLVVRAAALVPLVVALAWAAIRFVGVGYRELTNPSDVAMPVAVRIVLGAPDAVLAILATWLFSEIVGAVAARRIVLAGDGVRLAFGRGVATLRARPARAIGLAALSALGLLTVVGITAIATGTTWDALRSALADGDASIGTSLILVLFVGSFAAGLVLIGLVSAWRSSLWTVDVLADGDAGADGTFGGGGETRSGD
ncbi:MAG TPA: hypothetical protein VK867_00935 [Candidatus Limnocylindrales bacterium]|nr:hypothetical protein [Candidatus Limnocylindrales bacterium]